MHRSAGHYATTPRVMNPDFFPLETLNTPPSLYCLPLSSLFLNLLSTASYITPHPPLFLQPHATSLSLLPLTPHVHIHWPKWHTRPCRDVDFSLSKHQNPHHAGRLITHHQDYNLFRKSGTFMFLSTKAKC